MKFGVFDHLDAGGGPLTTFYEHRLRLAEAYDRIGIHALHVAEHHATPLGMAPSPSVFLAAVSQRTRRLRFGPLVYTLALYHPLRLADEICMLDQMSGGRFELGVGRGVSPLEIAYFGFDPAKSQAMYVEAYEVILKAMRVITDRYRAAWEGKGNDPKQIPFMGMTRHVVIAATDQEAMQLARRAYARWFESFIFLWRLRGATPPFTTYTEDFDAVLKNGQAIVGSPGTVRETIASQAKDAGLNYFLLRFAFGDLTLEESMQSVNLFASRVQPALEVVPA